MLHHDHHDDHDHAHDRTPDASPSRDRSVPGRASASAALHGPDRPVASGILSRKARDASGVAPEAEQAVAAAASSSGFALPGALQRKFESSLGVDLSGVRLHTGAASETSAAAVGARAYTIGQDIHFGAGHYAPGSPAGEHLLAHEVAHTVQQRGQAPARQHKLEVSAPGDHAELEADRAADAMSAGAPAHVTGAPSSTARQVHRALDPAQEKLWTDENGDALIQQLKGEISAWKGFAANPSTTSAMPGRAVDGIASRLGELFAQNGGLRSHALTQLGKDSTTPLREMASINRMDCQQLDTIGLTHRIEPKHTWSMTVSGSGDVARLGGLLPISTLSVKYGNALNWYYETALAGAMLGLGVSIGKEAGETAKGGASVAPAKVAINGSAQATNTLFWGIQNLPGPIVVANGPSGSIKGGGYSAKFSTGGVIDLFGTSPPNAPLHFKNFEGDASVKAPSPPKSEKDAKKALTPGASFTLVSMAAGYVAQDPTVQSQVAVPVEEPELVELDKTWSAQITGFETGADMQHGEMLKPLQDLKLQIDPQQQLVEADREALKKEFNIDQAFKLQFQINGSASRRWSAAVSEDERKRRNQELSLKRANNVKATLADMFGSAHTYTPRGVGGGVDLGGGAVAPEAGNEAALERLRAHRLEEARRQNPTMSEAELRKKVDAELGAGADQPGARRVEVKVTWRGYGIRYAQNASPAPRPVGGDPGGGGTGGAGGSGGRGGHEGSGPDGGGGAGGSHG